MLAKSFVRLLACMPAAPGRLRLTLAKASVPFCRELRSGNKIDATELRLEDGLFKSFDEIVRRQLDSVWHTVSYKTKQVLIPRRPVHRAAAGLRGYPACHVDSLPMCAD